MAKATPASVPAPEQQHTVQDYLTMLSNATEVLAGLRRQISVTEAKIDEQTHLMGVIDGEERDAEQEISRVEQEIADTQQNISAGQTTLVVVKGTKSEEECAAQLKVAGEYLTILQQELTEKRTNNEASHKHRMADRRQHETRRASLQETLEELRAQCKNFEQERDRCFQEAGKAEYRAIAGELTETRQRIEQARTELTALEDELKTGEAQVAQRLRAWPSLALQAQRELIPRSLEDNATQLLRAKIAYVDALETYAQGLRLAFPDRNIASSFGLWLPDVMALLSGGPQGESVARQHRSIMHGLLQEHKANLLSRIEHGYRSEEKRLARITG